MNVYITGIGAVSPLGMTARDSFLRRGARRNGSRPGAFFVGNHTDFCRGSGEGFHPRAIYQQGERQSAWLALRRWPSSPRAQAWEESG
jgi:hypothetical protein